MFDGLAYQRSGFTIGKLHKIRLPPQHTHHARPALGPAQVSCKTLRVLFGQFYKISSHRKISLRLNIRRRRYLRATRTTLCTGVSMPLSVRHSLCTLRRNLLSLLASNAGVIGADRSLTTRSLIARKTSVPK